MRIGWQLIEAKRQVLREITANDAEMIVKWRSDPNVYRYFKQPQKLTLERHMEWYDNVYLKDKNKMNWISEVQKVPIGVFGVERLPDLCVEISYILDSAYRKKGYASQAVCKIMDCTVANWATKRFVANIHRENAPSRYLIESIGFVRGKSMGSFLEYYKDL